MIVLPLFAMMFSYFTVTKTDFCKTEKVQSSYCSTAIPYKVSGVEIDE